MTKLLFPILVTILVVVACVPESKKVLTEVDDTFGSVMFRRIADLERQASSDSLVYLLSDKDPTARYLAARAFASIQDKKGLDTLYSLLDDPSIKVRSMAAYAIGQIGSPQSEQYLIEGFRQKDTMSVDNRANGAILAALGKLAPSSVAKFISGAEGYRASDTSLIEGQMQSLYQFGLRSIHDPAINEKIISVLRDKSTSTTARVYAAHTLARAKELDIEKIKFQIAEIMVNESNPEIKMALASALKHTTDPEIYTTLINQLELDQDYRVKCNIIRTLAKYKAAEATPIILELLQSENLHLARTAVEYVREAGDPNEIYKFRDIAKLDISPLVKTELYAAVSKNLPHYYTKTKNATHHISGYLRALGQDPENYEFIMDYLKETDDPVIKTAGIDALGTILAHEDFGIIYQSLAPSTRRVVLAFLKEQIITQDEGLVGAAANVIANPKAGLKNLIDSTDFLLAAKDKLKIPQEIESLHAVEKALAHLRGVTTPNLTKLTNSLPIAWDDQKDYDKVKAVVKTDKGNFTIDFFAEEAPNSVINFINLSDKNFYDNMIFHRVVPNFVIQTGSPRGDNYGGAAHVIRSEVGPLNYNEGGYVGMASAGLHTESSQWFVTHSATPHLDGKYTIFGKITTGMDVVHNIQVGDKIQDIIISKF